MPDTPQIINNRFTIQELLGKGGSGHVYRVHDRERDETVALKTLHDQTDTRDDSDSFKQEFQILSSISHPNVETVYEFGTVESGPELERDCLFFTSEYLSGDSLDTHIQQENLSWQSIVDLLVPICRALHFLHTNELIHFDVKPSNILKGEQIKLIDFGLAGNRKLEDGVYIQGSIPYVAPEMIRGENIDERVDLYSFGVTLFELLTGSLPFQGNNLHQILQRHVNAPPPKIRKRNKDIPTGLENLILDLLAKDPDQRISSPKEIIERLRTITGKSYEIETAETSKGYVQSPDFVGREDELQHLKDQWNQLRKNQGSSLVWITGEAGIGKTRLLEEFHRWAEMELVQILESRADGRHQTPLALFRTPVRKIWTRLEHLQEEPGEAEDLRNQFRGTVHKLLTNTEDQDDPPVLYAPNNREQFLQNISTFIQKGLHVLQRDTIFILEDLQHADDTCIELFEQLLTKLDDPPGDDRILVMASLRDTDVSSQLQQLRDQSHIPQTTIPLHPLPEQQLSAFVTSMFGKEARDFTEQILEIEESGNPRLLKQLLITCIETNVLEHGEKGWKFNKKQWKAVQEQISTGSILKNRFHQLSEPKQRFLKYLCAWPGDMPKEWLAPLLPFPPPSTSTIRNLLTKGLVQKNHQENIPVFRLSPSSLHPIIRDACSRKEWKEINAKLLDRFSSALNENLQTEDKTSEPLRIQPNKFPFIQTDEIRSRLAWESCEYNRFLEYASTAAKNARNSFALETAIDLYQKMIACTRDADVLMETWKQLGELYSDRGEPAKACRYDQQCLRKTSEDEAEWYEIHRHLAHLHYELGHTETAQEHYRVGKAPINQDDFDTLSTDIQYEALHTALDAARFAGRSLRNIENAKSTTKELHQKIKDLLPEGEQRTRLLREAESNLGTFYRLEGQYSEAKEHFQNSLTLSEELDDQEDIAQSTNNIGLIYMSQDQLEKAKSYFQQSKALCEKIGKQKAIPSLILNLGIIDLKSGELDRALENFQETYRRFREVGHRRGLALTYNNMGYIHEQKGNIDRALELYQRQEDIAREVDNIRARWRSLSNVSRLHMEKKSFDLARKKLQELEELSEEHDFTRGKLIAASRTARLRMHQESSNDTQASDQMHRAISLIDELDDHNLKLNIQLNKTRLLRFQDTLNDALTYGKSIYETIQGDQDINEESRIPFLLEYTGLLIVKAAHSNQEDHIQYAKQILQQIVDEFSSKNIRLSFLLDFLQNLFRIVRENAETAWEECEEILHRTRAQSMLLSADEMEQFLNFLPEEYAKNRPYTTTVHIDSDMTPAAQPDMTEIPEDVFRFFQESPSYTTSHRFDDCCERFLELLAGTLNADAAFLGWLTNLREEDDPSQTGTHKLSLVARHTSENTSSHQNLQQHMQTMKNALENGKILLEDISSSTGTKEQRIIEQILFSRETPQGTLLLQFSNGSRDTSTIQQKLQVILREAVPHLVRTRTIEHLREDDLTSLKTHSNFMDALPRQQNSATHHLYGRLQIDQLQKMKKTYGQDLNARLLKIPGHILQPENLTSILDRINPEATPIQVESARRIENKFEFFLQTESAFSPELLVKELIDQWEIACTPLVQDPSTEPTVSIGTALCKQAIPNYDELQHHAGRALTNAASGLSQNTYRLHNQSQSTESSESTQEITAQQQKHGNHRNQLLKALSRIVNSDLDFSESLSVLLETTVDITSARSGYVLMRQEDDGFDIFARHIQPTESDDPFTLDTTSIEEPVSRKIVRQSISEQKPLLIQNAAENETFQKYSTVRRLHLRSVLVSPIKAGDSIIGAMYLENSGVVNRFDQDDLDFVSSLAHEISGFLEHIRRHKNREDELDEIREKYKLAKQNLQTKYKYRNIVGKSEAMQNVYQVLDKVIPTSLNMIIEGETGTGKELAARAIHYNGPRKAHPFLAVNCARFSETLLESELFGHMKGSFTGAQNDKAGLFEQADQGTLFLDEISEMSGEMQAKLLRVLETGEVRRIGSDESKEVDVRIICATNIHLQEAMEEEHFRSDLYYRLEDAYIKMPSLDRRKEDIPLLVDHFFEELHEEEDLPRKEMEEDALQELMARTWPGNVRQLRSVIRQIGFFTGDRSRITKNDLMETLGRRNIIDETFVESSEESETAFESTDEQISPENFPSLEEWEKEAIQKAIMCSKGNKKQAAELLGIARSTLYEKLKFYNLLEQS